MRLRLRLSENRKRSVLSTSTSTLTLTLISILHRHKKETVGYGPGKEQPTVLCKGRSQCCNCNRPFDIERKISSLVKRILQ